LPHETDELPPANAVLVAPATFNTVNQWAAGINDTLSLGLLNELLGLKVPIVVAMYCKPALTAHPAYCPNIRRLQNAGVTILEGERSITVTDDVFSWTTVGTLSKRSRTSDPVVTGPSPSDASKLAFVASRWPPRT
jgi:hypothetical protein